MLGSESHILKEASLSWAKCLGYFKTRMEFANVKIPMYIGSH